MTQRSRSSLKLAVAMVAAGLLATGCESRKPDKNITAIPGVYPPGLIESFDGGMAPSFSDPDGSFANPSGIFPTPISQPAELHHRVLDPRGVPSLDEEVWVIVKPEYSTPTDDETPGCGSLFSFLGGRKEVPLPLEHTEVKAHLDGYIASTEVVQRFGNPFATKIEAIYVFPLPQNSAINEFIMTIGKRKIRGIIREREEATAIYEAAKSQGHTASLLTQERPNVFTQKVANIEPRKDIDITIRYFNTMTYEDGWYEYVFPMVVGPRYNPAGHRDGIGAVSRQARTVGQRNAVRYLGPRERGGHDVSVTIEIDSPIQEIDSINHKIRKTERRAAGPKVTLSPFDKIPNKDFVLRYRVANDAIQSALRTFHEDDGGYFSMMLYPPQNLQSLPRQPMEMIFVLDCSGSMSGRPIEQAKNAIRIALGMLTPEDTFQIIRFSGKASKFGRDPVPASWSNVRKAQDYLNQLVGSGGTEMIEGVKAALRFGHDENRLRFVCFMTDGYIGNEADILKAVHQHVGANRIFSFGVGQSPNRFLLNRMAKVGRGAVGFLSLEEDARLAMGRFFQQVSRPAMIDLRLNWGGAKVYDVFPKTTPDLFVGRPVIITGRFRGQEPSSVRVTGTVGGESQALRIGLAENPLPMKSLPFVWARHKIADLADSSMTSKANGQPRKIRQLALDYNLMSAYTAFVAVDAGRRTKGSFGTTVHQAVSVPEGVNYETTVDP